MGRRVFVSYKYSDAVSTREEIRKKLGKEGNFYNGEKGFVALEKADATIKEFLKEMIFGTSVTVVVISPKVRYSDWVDWEIRYSLRQPSRDGTKSYRNGIVCVIQNNKDWFGNENTKWAQDSYGDYRRDIFPDAILDNLQKTFPDANNLYFALFNSSNLNAKDYCVIVGESAFKADPNKYIEEAYLRAHDNEYEVVVNKKVFWFIVIIVIFEFIKPISIYFVLPKN